jgi:hypothetical protein
MRATEHAREGLRTWAAGRLPVRMNASSASRSASLSRTTYFLTPFSDMFRFPVTLATLRASHGTASESRTWGTSLSAVNVAIVRKALEDGARSVLSGKATPESRWRRHNRKLMRLYVDQTALNVPE